MFLTLEMMVLTQFSMMLKTEIPALSVGTLIHQKSILQLKLVEMRFQMAKCRKRAHLLWMTVRPHVQLTQSHQLWLMDHTRENISITKISGVLQTGAFYTGSVFPFIKEASLFLMLYDHCRGKTHNNKGMRNSSTLNVDRLLYVSGSCTGPEPEGNLCSLKDQIHRLEDQLVKVHLTFFLKFHHILGHDGLECMITVEFFTWH